jgi:predicted phosphoribosyltransferase
LETGRLIQDLSLRDKPRVFGDRTDAGRHLASLLRDHGRGDEIVLAIPAGGVPVASEIASSLSLRLDLVIVRKIQIPWNTEAGFGALDPDGGEVINKQLLGRLGLTQKETEAQIKKTKAVIEQRERLYRGDRPFPDLNGKDVILVDDGLASGYTMIAALRFVKRRKPVRTLIAIPTAPDKTIELLLAEADIVFCPNVRTGFPFAVAEAFRNWYDLTDEEVLSILKKSV